jgi:hypothetical protein
MMIEFPPILTRPTAGSKIIRLRAAKARSNKVPHPSLRSDLSRHGARYFGSELSRHGECIYGTGLRDRG